MYWQNLRKFLNNNQLKLFTICILTIILLTISLVCSPADSSSQTSAGDTNPLHMQWEHSNLPGYTLPLKYNYRQYLYNKCMNNNISYELMLALAYVESEFNHKAISSTNDYGTFQINRNLQHSIENRTETNYNALNKFENVDMAIWYVKYLREKLKRIYPGISEEELFVAVISCYNLGETQYLKHGAINQEYINKVLEVKTQLETGGKIGG